MYYTHTIRRARKYILVVIILANLFPLGLILFKKDDDDFALMVITDPNTRGLWDDVSGSSEECYICKMDSK